MGLTNVNPDQVFLNSFGTPSPTLASDPVIIGNGPGANDRFAAAQSASFNMGYYIGINPSIWKSYVAHPTNQGQRAAVMQRAGPMMGVTGTNPETTRPRNNPSRSQFSEGYTLPIQFYTGGATGAGNTWQTPSGRNSKGERLSQPSTKAVSPFSSMPIPTRMPWDL